MANSKWVNNAVGDWEIITRMPLVYRANSHNCQITISKDNRILRTLSFRRGAIVSYTITPNATGNQIQMSWQPPDSMIALQVHDEP